MSDDMFGNLQPATMKDALKAADAAPATRARVQKEADEVTKVNVPQEQIGRYLVVLDPSKMDEARYNQLIDDEAVVGQIGVPSEFCGLDTGICPAASQSKHMFSFTKEHGHWVHMDCGQPTRKWFTGAFLDLVTTDDQELSFLDSETSGHEGR